MMERILTAEEEIAVKKELEEWAKSPEAKEVFLDAIKSADEIRERFKKMYEISPETLDITFYPINPRSYGVSY